MRRNTRTYTATGTGGKPVRAQGVIRKVRSGDRAVPGRATETHLHHCIASRPRGGVCCRGVGAGGTRESGSVRAGAPRATPAPPKFRGETQGGSQHTSTPAGKSFRSEGRDRSRGASLT